MRLRMVMKNSVFYILASVLQGAMSFLLLPLYTRFLMPEDYAVLSIIASFIGALSTVITLQVHSGIPRFVIKFIKDEERAKIYFGSITLILALLISFSCFLIHIFSREIFNLIFSRSSNLALKPFIYIALWTALPNLLISSCGLLLQTLEQGKKFFIVSVAQVSANVVFGVIGVVIMKLGILGYLSAQFLASLVGLLCMAWFLRGWLRVSFRKFPFSDVIESLRYSIPIIPHMFAIYVYMYSDRLILQRYVSLSAIGIYSMGDTFAGILLILVNATTTAYSPRFLKLAQENKLVCRNDTEAFIKLWWFVVMGIYLGYLLFSKYVVRFMTQPNFFPAVPLIQVLAVAYIFRGLYCFAINAIFFTGETKYVPLITVSAAIINVVVNLYFIPRFGTWAAAWSTVISYAMTFILALYFTRKDSLVSFPWQAMAKMALAVVFVFVIAKACVAILGLSFLWSFLFHLTVFLLFMLTTLRFVFKNAWAKFEFAY